MPSDYIPKRVVSLQPSATVILAAIGQLDRLVACTKYCAEVCPEVRANGQRIIADSWTAKASGNYRRPAGSGDGRGSLSRKSGGRNPAVGSALSRAGAENSRGHLRRHCRDRRNHGRRGTRAEGNRGDAAGHRGGSRAQPARPTPAGFLRGMGQTADRFAALGGGAGRGRGRGLRRHSGGPDFGRGGAIGRSGRGHCRLVRRRRPSSAREDCSGAGLGENARRPGRAGLLHTG